MKLVSFGKGSYSEQSSGRLSKFLGMSGLLNLWFCACFCVLLCTMLFIPLLYLL